MGNCLNPNALAIIGTSKIKVGYLNTHEAWITLNASVLKKWVSFNMNETFSDMWSQINTWALKD